MSESPEVIVRVTADTKPAESSVQSFGDKLGTVATVAGGLIAAKLISKLVETTAHFAMLGEQVTAIEKRFELLAKQTGLVPEHLSAGIAKAIDGTVDMGDALNAAGQAFIKIGENAKQTPALFELARKAAAVFGGETVQHFNDITQAIASGNTRTLKQIGINVDVQKSYADYAKSVGQTTEELSEAQKQQAILNSTLTIGASKFKEISSSLTPIDEASKRAHVSLNELNETIGLVTNKYLGKTFENALNTLALSFDDLSKGMRRAFLGESMSVSDEIKKVQKEIVRTNELMALNPNMGSFYQKQLDELTVKLTNLGLKASQSEASLNSAASTTLTNFTPTFDAATITVAGLNTEMQALNDRHMVDYMNRLREAQAQWEEAEPSWANFHQGFNRGIISMGASVAELGKRLSNTLVTGMANSFAAFGAALATGGDAFGEFGRKALAALGAVCIQMGTMLVLAGMGWAVIPGFQASAAAIPIGLALIVLGGALQAIGGGGVGTGAAAAAGSGATPVVDAGGGMADMTKEEDRVRPETGVQVIVQGNILDRRESGLELVKIINESFDTNGTTVRAFA